MSISLCLLVGWEQKISEVVCSLISFVVCIFGRLAAFFALLDVLLPTQQMRQMYPRC